MRKGYNGLAGIVRNELNNDPLSGDVYVFLENRQIVKCAGIRMDLHCIVKDWSVEF
ncbi:MAG: IS66 family insertion sequence element accessory protein TnpB [Saprospiraceae bacterium]|nr:IS66 family insertion sequence element accessory protein TnpB [Saprospiraceae bacterium]